MENPVSKSAALAAYNNSVSALARALDITPQAIYQWADEAVPEVHALRLRFVLRPEFFRAGATANEGGTDTRASDRAESS